MNSTTHRRSANAYTQAQVNTAGPGQRVVMMYEGILKNLRIGLNGLDNNAPGDLEKVHNALQLAERLILELRLALDKENGGEVAANLDDLYDFWSRHVSTANAKKDRQMVADVIGMVQTMRDTWEEAVQSARQQGVL